MKKKIGVYICECGPNIADNVEIDRIIEAVSSIDKFEDAEFVVKNYGLLCSVQGKEYLEQEINENELTHLVVAACSPRDHNSTFIGVSKKTSLNPYLFKMINIREHCAWIIHDKEKATEKAIKYIKGGISRVMYQSELYEKQLDINPDVAVIGGGIAGIEAALELAGEKRKVLLIEKTDSLGGHAVRYSSLLDRQEDGAAYISRRVQEAEDNKNITVFKEARLSQIIGFLGNYEIVIEAGGEHVVETEATVGAVVVATGFDLMDPAGLKNISYKENDEVYTALEIEDMLSRDGKIVMKNGEAPKSVGLIHCAGRAEKGYCSGVCCNYLTKIAGRIRQQSSDIAVTQLFRDLCLPHKYDQSAYDAASGDGIEFIRVKDIGVKGCKVNSTAVNDEKLEKSFDMVIIAPALEPVSGTEDLAELLGISLNDTGFYQEAHHSINPEATSTDGIYIVGCAHGPKGITDSVLQAHAAAGRILSILIPGEKIVPEVKVSEVLEAYCMGCKTCLEVCSYGCISYDAVKGISVVNEAVCRGCGNCVGSCPSGAIRTKHFTSPQLYQEVFEVLK